MIPGSDTVLHLALARIILENGWEDTEFIEKWIASNAWEIDAGMGRGTRNTPWQWRTTWGQLGTDFEGYREWLFEQPHAELDRAAEITGVPADLIKQSAEMIAKPIDGVRPKTSFGFEKGNYWSNNYLNTASYAALASSLRSGQQARPDDLSTRGTPAWMDGRCLISAQRLSEQAPRTQAAGDRPRQVGGEPAT